jgi:replicative DNA helicase
MKIVKDTIHAGHAVHYAEEILEDFHRRQLQAIGADLCQRAADLKADSGEILDWLKARLATFDRGQQTDIRTFDEIADEVLSSIESAMTSPVKPGLMCGYESVDLAAGPTMRGEFRVLAARPNQGKTAFAGGEAEHHARGGRHCLFVSLEMKSTELVQRMLCSGSEIDGRDVRAGKLTADERRRLGVERDNSKGLPLRIWAPPSATFSQIAGVARYLKATTGLDWLCIDYLQLIRPSAEERRLDRHYQIAAVTAGLKSLAKELEIVVVAICQLRRDADGGIPKLSHLKDSGSIEQDADAVWFIHHPEARGSTLEDAYAYGCNLIIGKHRHGETGKVSLLWHPRETRFSSPTSF